MKYKGFTFKKIIDKDVDGGFYYEIYDDTGKFITVAWTLQNAKEFVYNGKDHLNWNNLC